VTRILLLLALPAWVPTGYYKIRDAGNGPMRGMSRWVHRIITRYHLQIHKNTSLRDVVPGG
jgi:hypothetical protein